MHNLSVTIVNGSYMFRLRKEAINRLYKSEVWTGNWIPVTYVHIYQWLGSEITALYTEWLKSLCAPDDYNTESYK
jgi:hypothetical protein